MTIRIRFPVRAWSISTVWSPFCWRCSRITGSWLPPTWPMIWRHFFGRPTRPASRWSSTWTAPTERHDRWDRNSASPRLLRISRLSTTRTGRPLQRRRCRCCHWASTSAVRAWYPDWQSCTLASAPNTLRAAWPVVFWSRLADRTWPTHGSGNTRTGPRTGCLVCPWALGTAIDRRRHRCGCRLRTSAGAFGWCRYRIWEFPELVRRIARFPVRGKPVRSCWLILRKRKKRSAVLRRVCSQRECFCRKTIKTIIFYSDNNNNLSAASGSNYYIFAGGITRNLPVCKRHH